MADITALQLITRIVDKTSAPNRPQTVDHVSAGDPTRTVSGIAVMAMATLDGLKAAAAARRNLVITYDPAFWSGNDDLDHLENDPLFLEKRDLIRAHDMVVFNLHDQFERLRAAGRYERLRTAIVDRDAAWTGTINPMLAQHGESSAARQFSGRAVPDDWACPFRRGEAPPTWDAQQVAADLASGAFVVRQMDS